MFDQHHVGRGRSTDRARRTGLKRKVDVVNEGLRVLVAQRRVHDLFASVRGRVEWQGDLDEMRHGRQRPR